MREQIAIACLGIWLTVAPPVLGLAGPARSLEQVAGPIIATLAVVAASDVARPLRWMTFVVAILFAAISIVPPFFSIAGTANILIVLLVLAKLTFATSAPATPYGFGHQADDGLPVPPGWDYNPSTWPQRLPLVGVAVAGGVIASYLAAFQLGLVKDVWDPFFGSGSKVILTSGVSRLLPVPDAALGAFGYLLDAVTGIIGGRTRWRTMPWIVILFGIAVGPLGATSVLLVILQPVAFGAWCTLCLSSAVISVLMIGPAIDEVLASVQHVVRRSREGASAWRVFWGRA
jgi:uncharacterized membrane protein